MELKLPLLNADDDQDDDDGDKIVIDTNHEITYGDLGETPYCIYCIVSHRFDLSNSDGFIWLATAAPLGHIGYVR